MLTFKLRRIYIFRENNDNYCGLNLLIYIKRINELQRIFLELI